MDPTCQAIIANATLVDAQLAKNAQTIVAQAAEIQSLKKQLADCQNPPPGIKLANLEKLTTWIQPGTTGNTGGGDPTAPKQGIMTPGAPARFATIATLPYHNPYWYIRLAGMAPELLNCTKFSYSLQFQFESQANLDACQAVEFELQQHLGTEVYNMAWQMELKQFKQWKTFDYTAKKWESTPTPIPVDMSLIAPSKWLSVQADYVRDPSAKTLTHTAITINGQKIPVNVTRPFTVGNPASSMNAGFQLDTNSVPKNYSVLGQNYIVTAS